MVMHLQDDHGIAGHRCNDELRDEAGLADAGSSRDHDVVAASSVVDHLGRHVACAVASEHRTPVQMGQLEGHAQLLDTVPAMLGLHRGQLLEPGCSVPALHPRLCQRHAPAASSEVLGMTRAEHVLFIGIWGHPTMTRTPRRACR